MAGLKKKGKLSDDLVQQFVAITGSEENTALHFLEACSGDLSAAIGMHMDSSGAASTPLPIPGSSKASTSSNGKSSTKRKKSSPPVEQNRPAPKHSDDDVRPPIPQKHEVLVTENYVYGRQGKRRKPHSVFDQFRDFQAEAKQHEMAQNGNGSSIKRRTLEDLFRPPIDLLHKGSFKSACEAAACANKWLITNIQNVQEFPCQVLNRDVWSNSAVKDVIRRHFILWQAYSDSEEGKRYMILYKVSEWPYVAVVDPRTGEKMISWHKLEANSFCEIASEFLELHPAPNESDIESSPSKKPKLEPSIVDASEDSQLTAAIAASIKEDSYKSVHPAYCSTSDDENTCMYSSASDLETFSDSDSSRPATGSRLPGGSPRKSAQHKFSVDQTVVCMTDTDSAASCEKTAGVEQKEGNKEKRKPQGSNKDMWKTHLGPDTDSKLNFMLRCPDGLRKQLSIPSSSKLMALVAFASEHGYPQDRYELVTTFPKRNLSQLDLSKTLRDSGLYSQETVFIQEI